MNQKKNLLGIQYSSFPVRYILEKIDDNLTKKRTFFHVISLNPENIIVANKQQQFKHVMNSADVTLIDGVGIQIAEKVLKNNVSERLTGVDFVERLIIHVSKKPFKIMFIGGRIGIAEILANCYQSKYPKLSFLGVQGIKDIQKSTLAEMQALETTLSNFRPDIVFVSFGSPYQEMWIDEHKSLFSRSVCVGVGGAFDFLSGEVTRAPVWMRKFGMEWMYRLFVQPWRWKRQLRLVQFMLLVMKQKLTYVLNKSS